MVSRKFHDRDRNPRRRPIAGAPARLAVHQGTGCKAVVVGGRAGCGDPAQRILTHVRPISAIGLAPSWCRRSSRSAHFRRRRSPRPPGRTRSAGPCGAFVASTPTAFTLCRNHGRGGLCKSSSFPTRPRPARRPTRRDITSSSQISPDRPRPAGSEHALGCRPRALGAADHPDPAGPARPRCWTNRRWRARSPGRPGRSPGRP